MKYAAFVVRSTSSAITSCSMDNIPDNLTDDKKRGIVKIEEPLSQEEQNGQQTSTVRERRTKNKVRTEKSHRVVQQPTSEDQETEQRDTVTKRQGTRDTSLPAPEQNQQETTTLIKAQRNKDISLDVNNPIELTKGQRKSLNQKAIDILKKPIVYVRISESLSAKNNGLSERYCSFWGAVYKRGR